ncbi:lysophospholipid acyltransferase family protein [Arenibaculum sp.]|uniref:lysophospholipid acyltransferase family protein n=1 Tax=Arenibaculum sp. TaxID=2865862 RepID=UPI002E0D7315|nr:lysophospholipid acyltransferase family protein [Arenibaculum sp.]
MTTLARSLLFNVAFFGWTALACIGLLWMLLLPRARMIRVVAWYMRTIHFLERTIVGIDYQVKGREHVPTTGPYLLAAKHQSAWETMKLHLLVDDPAVILKKELTYVPIWGWYARKARMIAVDRGGRGRAVSSMLAGARAVAAEGRPIAIFPQGTRTAPGTWRAYRAGIGILYEELGLPIVPMALNSGLYWPRRGFRKRPGTVTVEFLPPIPAGLPREEAVAALIASLEQATDRLVTAAGGPATERPADAPLVARRSNT